MGLISIAVAIPVTHFLQVCFEIANDNEAPESWLVWSFNWRKLVFGPKAHRRWHYTGPLGQPHRHVRWYIRSVDAPLPETVANLWRSLVAWLTCSDPPWVLEAREAAEEALEDDCGAERQARTSRKSSDSGLESFNPMVQSRRRSITRISSHSRGESVLAEAAERADNDGASTTSSARSALELQRYKRLVTATGVIGTYICWAVFAWFIFVRATLVARAGASTDAPWPQAYGALLYKLLGDKAEEDFARSWGVSYGMNAATEWRSVVEEAAKGAVFLLIMERLRLTSPADWLEQHVDYLSLCVARRCRARLRAHFGCLHVRRQALLFKHTTLGLAGQVGIIFYHSRRVGD